jgi:glycogen synthase
MNILHVIPRYLPARGGAEQYLAEVSQRLAAAGHGVTVLTTDVYDMERFWTGEGRRVSLGTETLCGVRVVRVPASHLPGVRLTYPALRRGLSLLSALRLVPTSWLHLLSRGAPYTPALRRWLADCDEPFDLVGGFGITFETLLEAALGYARTRDLPFVICPFTHLGAGPAPGSDALSRFYTMRHQVDLARRSSAVIAVTGTERDFYAGRGVAPSSILISGPGVTPEEVLGGDPARFREHHNLSGPIVASLSTLMYDKGTVHLIEAVRKLWRGGRDLHLVLAGTLLQQFRDYLAGLPKADRERLTVLGPVDDAEKRDLLAAANIFAMPSRTDSFGIVYLEAWLYGKPVIGARTWGVTDVIADEEDGLLVPFGDVDALAAALSTLLHNPERRAALGAAGRAKVYAGHTWAKKVPQIEALYAQLAGGKR